MALIHGTRHDDYLEASDGDRVNAGAGDDYVLVYYGGSVTAQLGRGSDTIENLNATGGKVWAGVGNDAIWWWGKGDALVGGKGDDFVFAMDGSNSYGDEGPGRAHQVAGNDHMQTLATSAGGDSTQTGGNGADLHVFQGLFDGLGGASHLEITDFQAGQDKLAFSLTYGAPAGGGFLNHIQIFSILDTNADGVLDGNDVPWDANSGTSHDADGNLVLRVHNNEVTLDHVAAISAADYFFG